MGGRFHFIDGTRVIVNFAKDAGAGQTETRKR